jgi:DoxX-like family
MESQNTISKPLWWTGTIVKGLLCLFLIFDAIMKLIMNPSAVENTRQMGLPESCIPILGVYLLLSTVLYIYPKTVMLGILFLAAYLGAAAGIMFRAGVPGHPYIFPIVFAIFIVIAEYLRNGKIRTMLPFTR